MPSSPGSSPSATGGPDRVADRELGGRLGRLVEGVAQRVGQHGDGGERDRRAGRPLDPHHPVDDLEVAGVGLQGVARDPQRLGPHLAGRERDRVAAHDRGARGEGAHGVAEPAGVAGDDLDVLERHAQLVGGDLRERREVALALGGEPGRDLHLAGGLDHDVRALVRADAGALDVAGQADADLAAGGPGRRRLGQRVVPADQLHQLLAARPGSRRSRRSAAGRPGRSGGGRRASRPG